MHVPPGTAAPSTVTKGLRVRVGEHQVVGHPVGHFLDVACLDAAAVTTFAAVAAEIAHAAGSLEGADRAAAAGDVLDRWKWFWEVDSSRLTDSEALGLFAELWFLVRWVGVMPAHVDAWTASEGSRHDFQWPHASVEVKATARGGDAGSVHTIRSLDQLADPETGELYLFSLRVVRDQLANNTLPKLVERVSTNLADHPAARERFLQKVGRRGYSPIHRKTHEIPYRVVEEGLYRVSDDFPRLTRDNFPAGLPDAVVRVSYGLDMAACGPWLISSNPMGWSPDGVHS
ncbi:PD-(D/E)XK motif protein [Streptomyces sp. MBT49]|uniref:PD-(D/E)XK motif protein n=1 Tax=Streptomyces sp. MBT49 TaxID=1488380 RepID=UPI001F2CD5FE|nr:PD-(D/E)XK motif protein [Streptomyces sp. MBT49]